MGGGGPAQNLLNQIQSLGPAQGMNPGSRMSFGGAQSNGKKSPPSPPNLYGAAEAQSDIQNQYIGQQTLANRPNISTPFANQQWTRGPDGSWQLSSSLAGPYGQAANALGNQIAGQAGTPLPSGEAGRQAATDAVYKQYASRLDPMWNQREEQERTQLINQGLDPSSQAAQTEMGNFNRARTDAYQSALRDAATAGMQQQALSFGQDVMGRQIPFQQLQQLQGLTATPGFNAAGQYQAPDYLGAAGALGQMGMQNFGAQQQKKGNTFGGLSSLGGAGLMALGMRRP